MGLIKFWSSLVMMALFAVAIMTFTVNFGADNNSAVLLSADPDFADYTNTAGSFQGNLSSLETAAESNLNTYDNSIITGSSDATASGAQFEFGVYEALGMVSTIMGTAYVKIFGADNGFSIFLTVLLAMIASIAGWLMYKAWAGRNPE